MKRFPIFLLLLFAAGRPSAQTVVLNEIMSRNGSVAPDAEGHFHDWIEIHNPSVRTVCLEGYRLSDDPARPDRWTFPFVEIAGKSSLLIRASDEDPRSTRTFETVIDRDDRWRTMPGSVRVPHAWYTARFDDATWDETPGGFGTDGGADSAAADPAVSRFGRIAFFLSGKDSVTDAVLHVDYQDGFVAYVNGREVARRNMGAPGDHPAWDRLASATAEARIRNGRPPAAFRITVDASLFKEGKNVLAIQVHAARRDAGRLTLIPFLTLGRTDSEPRYDVPPGLPLFDPPLDAGFRIKAGETLVLSDPSSAVLDSAAVPELPASASTGRFPDGGDAWRWMSSPSPGTSNHPPFVEGITPPPVFDVPAGYHSAGVVVTVRPGAPGDSVRFTTDGSEPGENAPARPLRMRLESTGVIRARAFRPGFLPSPVVTRTFLIGEPRPLPVVSLTTDPRNLWDFETGIYVMGPNASPGNPYFGANFWQDWEKPGHAECFETDGSAAFSLDAGIAIYGAWSRAFDQKSMALYFRGGTGDGGIDYRVFPDLPIRRFETLLLRNSGNDWQQTLFRDGLMQTLVRNRTAIDALAYRPAVLMLNGEYWGILNLREKPDAHFLAGHHGVDPDGLDLLAFDGNTQISVIEGSAAAWDEMTRALASMDMSTGVAFAFARDRIDLDNFMDYMAAEITFDNTDWPGNNVKFWRSRTSGAKWRWILYDTDFGFGLYDGDGVHHNTLAFALDPSGSSWPNPPASTFLLRRLVGNPVFRNRFINRMADHLNSTFEANRVRSVIDSLASAIAPEIPAHQARWPNSAQNWESQVDRLRDFAERRVPAVRTHVIAQFGLSGTVRITVDASDRTAGAVAVNSVETAAFPWTGTYFRRVPVEITARPRPGTRFAGWSVPGLGDSTTAVFDCSGDLSVTARFERDTGRIRPVIDEINYHSSEAFDTGDWVELFNPSRTAADLSGWTFGAGRRNPACVLPQGTVLAASGYAVLSADPVAFRLLCPDAPCPVIALPFNFRNSGDTLRLADPEGIAADSLVFGDDAPWPVEADGSGFTLSLPDPEADNADPSSWTVSRSKGGTPGRPNSFLAAVERRPHEPPSDFGLNPVFPNPFNASTVIRWDVPVRSRVSVVVLDVRGRRVGTVADGESAAGRFERRWSLPLPNGVYVVRMTADTDGGRFSAIRKMVCIR
jgi:hypothetical protein